MMPCHVSLWLIMVGNSALCINSDFLDVSLMVLELKVAVKMWFLKLKSLLLVVVLLSVPSLPVNGFGSEMSFVGLPSILMLGT